MTDQHLTINEIARLAGVSKGTVSKIINNRPGVGAKTREKVLDLIKHLDFHPSSTAQALANRRTMNIGLIIPHEAGHSLNGSYWSTLITSISQRAIQDSYNLMLFTPVEEGALDEMYDGVLRSKKVDGLIIGSELMDKRTISRLLLAGLPFVLIGQNQSFQHHYVDIDNKLATENMIRYMINRGYKNIGFLGGPKEFYYNIEREQGFWNVVHNSNVNGYSVEVSEYTTEIIYQGVDDLLKEYPEMDSLFIAVGGDFMFDALTQLKRNDVKLSSIGLTVFDDYSYIDFIEPKLTAVKQPLFNLGKEATQMLLSLINGKELDQLKVILPTSITERESC